MTQPGVYYHFKGGSYRVLFTANDSTVQYDDPVRFRRVVAYINQKTLDYWTRPETEFNERVCQQDGCERWGKVITEACRGHKSVPRFTLVRAES